VQNYSSDNFKWVYDDEYNKLEDYGLVRYSDTLNPAQIYNNSVVLFLPYARKMKLRFYQ